MSQNVILTPKVFAKLVLMDLGGSLKVARNLSKSVTPEFGQKMNKVGATVSVRRPYRFIPGSGIDWDPQPIVDQVMPVSVKQVAKVHYLMDSVEHTLDIREAQKLYTKPVGLALASQINAQSAQYVAQNALNAVGTPGTAPTTVATYLAAGDQIVQQGLPEDESLTLIVNRKMSSAFVGGTTTLYNPTGSIGKQFLSGVMSDPTTGYKVERDQGIYVGTQGTFAGSPVVSGANQTAAGGNSATMTLNLSGFTPGSVNFLGGERFTIGSASSATVNGVDSVHPQTRLDTGSQQVFTILAPATDTAGAVSVLVAPAITPVTLGPDNGANQYSNVNQAPVANAIVTMMGTTGQSGINYGLLLHESSFAFISVPLWNPPANGVIASENTQDPETGLNISLVKYFDGDARQEKTRWDVLWDNARLYPELATVIFS